MANEKKQQADAMIADATTSKATATNRLLTLMGLDKNYSIKDQFLAAGIVGGISLLLLFAFRKQLSVAPPQHEKEEETTEEDKSHAVELVDEAKKTEPEDEAEDELGYSMTFLEHLGELRIRMIRMLIAFSLAVIFCFIFSDKLVFLLRDCIPESNVRLVTLHPVEAFLTILKVSLVAGIFVAFPVIFYEIWMFVAPGLYRKERKFVLPLVVLSWFCFVLGGVFCYLVVFRFALAFFASMAGNTAENMWGLSNYLNFMVRFLLAFGIVFEEPVIILILAKIGLVTRKALASFRPYAIICMFILAAIITPPDPISQLMCAGPLLALYEISIILVGIVEKGGKWRGAEGT